MVLMSKVTNKGSPECYPGIGIPKSENISTDTMDKATKGNPIAK